MSASVWNVTIRDTSTGETFRCDQVVDRPLAQANAEVGAIRAVQRLRPSGTICCMHSHFVRDVVDGDSAVSSMPVSVGFAQ